MKKFIFTLTLFLCLSLTSTNIALAGCTSSSQCSSGQTCIFTDPSGLEGECMAEAGGSTAEAGGSATGGTSVGGSATRLNNPLTGNTSAIGIPQLVKKITTTALGLTGVLALLAFIYGGLLWMISGGDSGKVTKGKNTMVWAIAGLLVIFCSYAIIKLVFEALGVTS